MDLIMELGFAPDVEIYRLGLVIVLEPSDFQFVEFNKPRVQLFKETVYLARLPLEAEDRLAVSLASADDVADDLFNRGSL